MVPKASEQESEVRQTASSLLISELQRKAMTICCEICRETNRFSIPKGTLVVIFSDFL